MIVAVVGWFRSSPCAMPLCSVLVIAVFVLFWVDTRLPLLFITPPLYFHILPLPERARHRESIAICLAKCNFSPIPPLMPLAFWNKRLYAFSNTITRRIRNSWICFLGTIFTFRAPPTRTTTTPKIFVSRMGDGMGWMDGRMEVRCRALAETWNYKMFMAEYSTSP